MRMWWGWGRRVNMFVGEFIGGVEGFEVEEFVRRRKRLNIPAVLCWSCDFVL